VELWQRGPFLTAPYKTVDIHQYMLYL